MPDAQGKGTLLAAARHTFMNNTVLNRARERVLDMISKGLPLCEVLTFLVHEVETNSDGRSVCSVLLLDDEGLLRNGASPGLPADYLSAIDRLKPDPGVGTCAAAAATGRIVITPNLLGDAGWKELRHLPLALGLLAAWSVPLLGRDGSVLGTFGTYFRDRRPPAPEERTFVEKIAKLAAMAVEAARSGAGTMPA